MSVSTIPYVNPIQCVHTVVDLSGTLIAGHGGTAKNVTVTIPSGYTLVGHVACWTSGVIGTVASFDAYRTTNIASIWINNTLNDSMTIGSGVYLHVLTLVRPS